MYTELITNLEKQISASELNAIKSSTLHLGIFTEPVLSYMLNGQKTIESRFSKNKILPYEKINKDDIVFVKKSGGNVLAYFTIKDVLFFDLTKTSIDNIRKKYEKYLYVSDDFWFHKKDSNYATLIFIDQIKLLKPFPIKKKGMNTWLKLNN